MAELSERVASGPSQSAADGEAEASKLNQGALEFMLGAQRMIATDPRSRQFRDYWRTGQLEMPKAALICLNDGLGKARSDSSSGRDLAGLACRAKDTLR